MAKQDEKGFSFDDKVKIIFTILASGGIGLGTYSGYFLSARITAIEDARKAFETVVRDNYSQCNHRIDRLEDRINR